MDLKATNSSHVRHFTRFSTAKLNSLLFKDNRKWRRQNN
jgi:hypothetical protein